MKMDKVAGSGNEESVVSDSMIGQTFNRWKVLARAPNRKEKKYYLCQCSCAKGTIKEVAKTNLVRGKSKSCGCLASELTSLRNKHFENQYTCFQDYCIGIDSNGNKFVIDLEDYEKIKPYCWIKNKSGYMTTTINKKKVFLHRFVLNLCTQDQCVVDHIDRNKLNNRKENLRKCSTSENILNAKLNKNNKSGYKGVFYNKKTQKWEARIAEKGEVKWLGSFKTKLQAIEARKQAEEERWEKFYENGYYL